MGTVLTIIHVLTCVLLIVVVLLQSSKGGGLAGAFGGGQASNAVFGGRGAGTFLSKLTTGLAVLFMMTSLILTVLGRQSVQSESVLRQAIEQEGRGAVPQAGLPRPVQPLESQEEPAAGTETPSPAPAETPADGQ